MDDLQDVDLHVVGLLLELMSEIPNPDPLDEDPRTDPTLRIVVLQNVDDLPDVIGNFEFQFQIKRKIKKSSKFLSSNSPR